MTTAFFQHYGSVLKSHMIKTLLDFLSKEIDIKIRPEVEG